MSDENIAPATTCPSNGIKDASPTLDVVILYPSLGAPTFVTPEGCLYLVVLGPDADDEKAKLTAEAVNAHLRVTGNSQELLDWKHGVFTGVKPQPLFDEKKIADGIQCDAIKPDQPLQIDALHLKALWDQNIMEHYQKEAGQKNSTSEKKQQELDAKSFKSLYQIKIDLNKYKVPAGSGPRYFLHWFGIDTTCAWPPTAMEGQARTFQRILLNTESSGSKLFIGERLAQQILVCKDDSNIQCLTTIDYTQAPFAPDSKILLTDYHPFYWYTQRKNHFDIGFISDLHHVTKFRILKNSPITVIPGDTSLPKVGEQLLETVEVLKEHFETLKSESSVDVIVVAGDLVDFHEDNFPQNQNVFGSQATNQDIWNACHIEKERSGREANYQAGTSALGMFRLIADLVLNSDKPIILISGNHDGYSAPFGISPRVGSSETSEGADPAGTEFMYGNEGIPADCNLTVMEACLAFGKNYDLALASLTTPGFQAENLQLFYLLYTPFRSWTFRLGILQQLLVLDWGDSESIILNQDTKFIYGHLPHADDSYKEADLDVATYAANFATADSKVRTMACAHATFACYSPDVVIDPKNTDQNYHEFPRSSSVETVEERRAREAKNGNGRGTNQYSKTLPSTTYNYGTFTSKRPEIFSLLESSSNRGISLCLSGHAHRAAAYQIVNQRGASDIHVEGFHFENLERWDKTKCLIAVSDSAGPIPRDNRADGLLGWGSRPSAWTKVSFDGDGIVSNLKSITGQTKNIKPRLAVALDYIETSVVVDKSNLLPEGLIPWTWPMGYHEIDTTAKGSEKRKYQRLWKLNKSTANDVEVLCKHFVIIANNTDSPKDDDYYYSIATSCAVSGQINPKIFEYQQPILFHFNEGAFPLPKGVSFKSMDLQGTLPTAKGPIDFNCKFPYKSLGGWELTQAEIAKQPDNESGNSFGKLLTNTQPSTIFSAGWIKIHFTGSSDIYDISKPWVIKVFLVLQPEGNGNRLLIVRDCHGMERPNHLQYLPKAIK